MKLLRYLTMSIGLALFGESEAGAQERSGVKVDPGVSIHNYKHPNKAAKAREGQAVKRRSYTKRVGIVQRSTNNPIPKAPHETPRYSRRTGWMFFKRSWNKPTTLNPLTNPNHYKVNVGH